MAAKLFRQIFILGLGLIGISCDQRTLSVTTSGTIQTDESHIGSRYGGRVTQVLATEGDHLVPGQAVVVLDAAELQGRRDEVAAMLAELEAGPRSQELQAAKSDWESMRSDLELAQADRKRALDLAAQHTISDSEKDRWVSRAATLELSVAAAKSRYDLLVAGTRPERIAQARAQLAQIDTQLKEMKIVAPTNSVLEVLSVKPGDVVSANHEVATLLLTQHLWVRVYVPETWLGLIKLGDAVKVRVDSHPGRDFEGVVEQINRNAEFTPRNVQTVEERIKQVFGVKIRLKNDTEILRAGMSADVVFPNLTR